MEFIQYTDKYGMGDASSVVYDALRKVLRTTLFNMDSIYGRAQGIKIQPSHVETVFRVTTSGTPLRMMILQAALSTAGMTGNKFERLERECEGFAAELLAQMRPILKNIQIFI
jgi:hypothetical protein